MNPRRLSLILIFISAALLSKPFATSMSGDDWLPIDPAELKMTGEPKAPGAPAVYLARLVEVILIPGAGGTMLELQQVGFHYAA